MTRPILLAAVSLVLASCASGRDRAPAPTVVVSKVVRTSVPATRVELFGPAETGVQGNVTVMPAGGRATLRTQLYWGAGPAVFDGELRRGSCARLGEPVAALEPVETDTRGGGSSRSVVLLPDGTAESLAFLYYERGSDPERPVVCGAFRTE